MAAGKSLNLKVHPAENSVTLIEFLSNRLGVSRNMAKGIIDRRCVFVNGRRVWMARHGLKTGDNITGSFSAEKPVDIKSANILYEDRDYLIVNKPAGLPSNGPNSVEQLLNKQPGNESAVACHRLDKDTSGCLIFAKSTKAKERIIALFARNEITKKYEAVIRGRLPKETMTITAPIDGLKAITHISLLDATPSASHACYSAKWQNPFATKHISGVASHISISIETGRTHQIRKHLASIGHPVLGDQHYGVGREVPHSERLIGRQVLHAAEIKFTQPFSGLPVHAKAPLPDDMKDCLRQYRLK